MKKLGKRFSLTLYSFVIYSFIIGLVFLGLVPILKTYAEELTLTTYYPAPYGVYGGLAVERLGVGDNDDSGTLDAGDAPSTPGEVWIKGRVGIGTTDPRHKIEVKQGNIIAGWGHFAAGDSTAGGSGALVFDYGRDVFFRKHPETDPDWNADLDGTVQNTTMVIKSSGYVGIGTTDPQYPLHVKGDWGVIGLDTNAADRDAGVNFLENGNVRWHIYNDADNGDLLSINPAGGSGLSITQAGEVGFSGGLGLGTTGPLDGTLDIKRGWGDWITLKSESNTGFWHIHNPSSQDELVIGYHKPDGTDVWGILVIDKTGRIGIGGGNPIHPTHTLEVAGDVLIEDDVTIEKDLTVGTGVGGDVEVKGDLTVRGKLILPAISYCGGRTLLGYDQGGVCTSGCDCYDASSRKYKKDIRDLVVNADDVLQLRPIKFVWKESGKEDIGLLAEEVDGVIKDLVLYDKEGKPDGIKYNKVTLYLLEVIKGQQKEIHDLKKAITNIEKLFDIEL